MSTVGTVIHFSACTIATTDGISKGLTFQNKRTVNISIYQWGWKKKSKYTSQLRSFVPTNFTLIQQDLCMYNWKRKTIFFVKSTYFYRDYSSLGQSHKGLQKRTFLVRSPSCHPASSVKHLRRNKSQKMIRKLINITKTENFICLYR